MIVYEVILIDDDGHYFNRVIQAENIHECKRIARKFGSPIRIYRGGNLIWEATRE